MIYKAIIDNNFTCTNSTGFEILQFEFSHVRGGGFYGSGSYGSGIRYNVLAWGGGFNGSDIRYKVQPGCGGS